MTQEFLKRLLRSMRWVIKDLKWRFDESKSNLEEGSQGGYSDELKELIALEAELSQKVLFDRTEQANITSYSYDEKICKDVAVIVGGTEQDGTNFFLQYARSGFKLGNGQPIVDLKSAIRKWVIDQKERDPASPPPRKTCTGFTPRQLDIQAQGR